MEIVEVKDKAWITSQEAFDIYKQCLYKASYEEYAKDIIRILDRPSVRAYVCTGNGRKVGIIVVDYKSNNTAEIIGIAAEKDLQGKGIGRAMVDHVAKEPGIDMIVAETDRDAVGFYERIGFTILPYTRHFPDGDVVRYQCKKILNYE